MPRGLTRAEYDTRGEDGPSEKPLWARQELADREMHFHSTLPDTIVEWPHRI